MRISANVAYLAGGATALAGVTAGVTGLIGREKHRNALVVGGATAAVLGGVVWSRNVSAATVHSSADVLMGVAGLGAGLGVSHLLQ